MSVYSDRIVSDGSTDLLSYHPADAVFGSADVSGHNHPLAPKGGPTVGGIAGPAQQTATDLDGTDDRLWMGNGGTTLWLCDSATGLWPRSASATRTIEMWAKRDTSTAANVLIATTSDVPYMYLKSGSNDLVVSVTADGFEFLFSGAWPGNGQWVHVMWVANDSAKTVQLLINGVSKGTQSTGARVWGYTNPTGAWPIIGATHDAVSPFDGGVCHVATYNGNKASLAAAHYALGLTYIDSGAASLSLTGSGTDQRTNTDTGAAVLALSGTETDALTHAASVSGVLTTSGSISESYAYTSTPVAVLTLSGHMRESQSSYGGQGVATYAGTPGATYGGGTTSTYQGGTADSYSLSRSSSYDQEY